MQLVNPMLGIECIYVELNAVESKKGRLVVCNFKWYKDRSTAFGRAPLGVDCIYVELKVDQSKKAGLYNPPQPLILLLAGEGRI